MNVKISHYVAEIAGKAVYETSYLVHDDEAHLVLINHRHGMATRYINPIDVFWEVPLDAKIYRAKRFMTEKKKEFIRPQFTGGVQE